MEQPKHTPGPWTIEMEPYGPESFDGFLSIESATQTICTDVSNCDAPLISAAPDLLEILTELYKSDQTMVFIPRHIQQKMKAAIGKAKGGEIEDKRTH